MTSRDQPDKVGEGEEPISQKNLNDSAPGNASPATSARRQEPSVGAVDTFTVEAKPILSKAALKSNKNDALRMLFVGELLPRLLKLGGPGLISQLCGVSDCREAIDCLSDEVKKELGLPVLCDELNMDSIIEHLRPVLTEALTIPFIGQSLGYSTLNHIGFLAMAASPLTSQRAMLNMIGPTCSNTILLDTIASNPSASPTVLARIFDISIERGVTFDSPPVQVLLKLSMHPNTPSAVLDTLLESVPDPTDGNWLTDATFYNVAKNKNTIKKRSKGRWGSFPLAPSSGRPFEVEWEKGEHKRCRLFKDKWAAHTLASSFPVILL